MIISTIKTIIIIIITDITIIRRRVLCQLKVLQNQSPHVLHTKNGTNVHLRRLCILSDGNKNEIKWNVYLFFGHADNISLLLFHLSVFVFLSLCVCHERERERRREREKLNIRKNENYSKGIKISTIPLNPMLPIREMQTFAWNQPQNFLFLKTVATRFAHVNEDVSEGSQWHPRRYCNPPAITREDARRIMKLRGKRCYATANLPWCHIFIPRDWEQQVKKNLSCHSWKFMEVIFHFWRISLKMGNYGGEWRE